MLLAALTPGCGHAPAAAPTVVVKAESSSPPPAPRPQDGFRDPCRITLREDDSAVYAIKDDGATFTIGVAESVDGPFEAVKGRVGGPPFRVVLEGAALDEPDFAGAFEAAGVKRADVARVTVYVIFGHQVWSYGMEIISDAKGRSLGKAWFAMRAANARPCGSPARG
jgi:hypothetical protein